MAVGVMGDDLMVRVGPDAREDALDRGVRFALSLPPKG
jgi:hypothetical protein